VHCKNPGGGVYGGLAATISGVKPLRVYTAHGFHFHPLGGRITNVLFRAIETFAGRFLSDAVLTINQWDYEQAKKMMPPERVYLTPGVGVSTDKFDPAKVTEEERQAIRKEFDIPDDGYLVTCIGEFIPRKRHEHIFWGLHKGLIENFAPKTSILLVGVGERVDELKALAEQNGVKSYFPGFRRDIPAILAATDVFIFPSLQEGLACSIQEALSMEVPVACYDVRGCSDLVDSDSGIVVKAGNSIRLGQATVEILLRPVEERAAMGRAGRKKMVDLYDRPKCIEAWLKIYDDLRPMASPNSTPAPREAGEGVARSAGGGPSQ